MEPDVLFTNRRLQTEIEKLRSEETRLMKEIDGYKKRVENLYRELNAAYGRIKELEDRS